MTEQVQVYFMSQYQTRQMLRGVREDVERKSGAVVVSSWLDTEDALLGEARSEDRQVWIERDLRELLAADVVVCFSLEDQHGWGSGGRHVEFGYALALKTPILLVGRPENLFHYHSSVVVVPTLAQLPLAIVRAEYALHRMGRVPTLDGATTT